MDSETEVIRQQMEGTRTALSEKLGKLEEQLDQKVHQTAETVAETVESVSETVEGVKDTVEGTVDAVKHTFDLDWHAQHHPWLLVGGAVAAGYLGTAFLLPRRRSARRDWEYDRRRERERFEQERRERERERQREQERQRAEQHRHQGHPHGSSGGGFLGALAPLLDLKKVGIGLAMGVAREMISSALPATLGSAVADAINQVTTRLGGQPIGASELPFTSHHEPTPEGQQQPQQRQAQGSGI